MNTRTLAVSLLTVLLTTGTARADTCTWVAGNGDWELATNWDCGRVPLQADTTIINNGAAVSLVTNVVSDHLVLDGGSALTGSGNLTIVGTLTFNGASAMIGTGEINIKDTATLHVDDGTILTLDQTLIVSGTTHCNAEISGSGEIVNSSGARFERIGNPCFLRVPFVNQEGAVLSVPIGVIEVLAGLTNEGTIEVFNNGFFIVRSDIISSGLLRLAGSSVQVVDGATLTVADTLRMANLSRITVFHGEIIVTSTGIIDGTTAQVGASALDISVGRVTVEKGGKLIVPDLRIASEGVLDFAATTEIGVLGNLDCEGLIQGSGTFLKTIDAGQSGCTIAPGASPGIMTISGNYANPILDIELGGLTPGSEHDQLAVTGVVILDGTLRVRMAGAYLAGVGDTYTIVTGSSITGAFADIELPTGMTADINVKSTQVDLVVTAAPVGTEDVFAAPGFELRTPYPNPIGSSASVTIYLPRAENLRLAVFDVLGREVSVLLDGRFTPGEHVVSVDASGWSSGVYFLRMSGSEFRFTRQVVVQK